MKIKNVFISALSLILLASCTNMDDIVPSGRTISSDQRKEAQEAIPTRAEATLNGLYTMMGQPCYTYGTDRGRADDFGYIMVCLSNDLEGADCIIANSGYNWFSVCGEYSSRYANYANPYIRYASFYNQIKAANDIIAMYSGDEMSDDAKAQVGQAKAMRALDYLTLAPSFQFNYQTAPDKACVPLVTEATTNFTTNPRATVSNIYNQIINDLTDAIDLLKDYKRPDKTRIDQQVAYGLRARAYLAMGKYAEAAEDADKAMVGYTPASIADISKPAFCSLNESNWMFGLLIDASMVADNGYPTSSSWISTFSGDGYSAACQCTPFINTLLYNKIPSTDVRKGWWIDANLSSPLLDKISWNGKTGVEISYLEITDSKLRFLPYFNVKFGMKSGIGSTVNNNDWPIMRVEEMILIKAEGLAMSGKEGEAKTLLENFVKTYRDPSYTQKISNLQDEIWMQRRIELWGEGFAMGDIMRLGKPVVRFHQGDKNTNYPETFRFNMAHDDPWLLMRFPQSETNTNSAIIDNTGGSLPTMGQNGSLLDGVTD